MIVRSLPDGSALLILQEAHADVAAQFAAHWGNQEFSRLDPYSSMLFGTIYHDSGHREMEADLPIDPEKGLPYAFRGAPPEVRRREADDENVRWIRARDPYASLVVSVHHAGLRKQRYDTVRMVTNGTGALLRSGERLGIETAFADLDGWRQEVAVELALSDPELREAFWHNYRCLQVFDLLSLYFCCDGYQADQMQEVTLERAPVAYGSERVVDLHLMPTGPATIQMMPYPFDVTPLQIGVMARQMTPRPSTPAAKQAYHEALRHPLIWQITSALR